MFETFNYVTRITHNPNFYVSIILMVSVTTLIDIALNRNADFLRVILLGYIEKRRKKTFESQTCGNGCNLKKSMTIIS